jgi:tetratricopeptide (TPR) repeat protein
MSVPSPIAAQVRRIRELLEHQHFAQALSASETLAAQVPENCDVLYMKAVSQRYLNDLPGALATLEHLEKVHPTFSRLYQERGHCHVALRNAPQAIAGFLAAVNINPALPASWRSLERLYRMVGEDENANTAAEHIATLDKLPVEIITSTALFSDGDLAGAESMVRAYLLEHGNHVEAMRLLARIGIERRVFDDAQILLEGVLQLAPDYRAARFEYARTLLERHDHPRALAQLQALLEIEPNNRRYKTLYATVCVGLGEHEKAVSLYRELLVDAPQDADLYLSIAHALKTLGRREESIQAYHAAAAARSGYGDAYWSLANLKTYRFTVEEISRMRAAAAAAGTALTDQYHLCFALGKAYEDSGEYAESFLFYERGNALKNSENPYRPDPIERNTRLQKEICSREFFAARAMMGAPDPAPIFIIGLPRSGSTLLEQILASHSYVEGTQELADIPRIVHELQGRDSDPTSSRYPQVLAQLTAADFSKLGEKYLHDTRMYRTHKPYFIDKMPNNFRHVGLIHLMLPNAKIIDARREPMACCFSNFKQLFAAGQEFSYSIEHIARYYRTYLELMRHWDEVLPGRVLRVLHEAVVDDLEGSVRRILEFCALDFERSCVEFYNTQRSVRTASSEQVRQPIFRDGLDQWKNYQPWLGNLSASLGDAIVRYRE